MDKVFYKCELCGNLVGLIQSGGGTLVCCDEPMVLLEANSKDASQEKHVPVAALSGNTLTVTVGEALHPMTPEHYIQWIMVNQNGKTQRQELTPENEPKAVFTLDAGKGPVVIYAYCNLHGLWQKEV